MQYYRFHCTCSACGNDENGGDANCQFNDTGVASGAVTTGPRVVTQTAAPGLCVVDSATPSDAMVEAPIQNLSQIEAARGTDEGGGGQEGGSRVVVSVVVSAPCIIDRKITDAARVRARDLDRNVMLLVEEGEVYSALECAEDLVRCLKAPAGRGWSERFMAEAYLNVFHIARSMMVGERPSSDVYRKYKLLAQEHLVVAHRWNVMLQGDRSADSITTRTYLEEFS